MRERGLKLVCVPSGIAQMVVAPHAGAWIETNYASTAVSLKSVAPHAGAWIETLANNQDPAWYDWSLPMRERGLKLLPDFKVNGRWIVSLPMRERGLKLEWKTHRLRLSYRRSPCGSVD